MLSYRLSHRTGASRGSVMPRTGASHGSAMLRTGAKTGRSVMLKTGAKIGRENQKLRPRHVSLLAKTGRSVSSPVKIGDGKQLQRSMHDRPHVIFFFSSSFSWDAPSPFYYLQCVLYIWPTFRLPSLLLLFGNCNVFCSSPPHPFIARLK